MSPKFAWNRTSETSLLELVRHKRFLWDHKDPLYSKTKLKQGALNAIADELLAEYPELSGLKGGHVRMKFKNLRTYFMTVHNKTKNAPSGSQGCPGKPWSLFKSASFLIDSLVEQTPTVATYTLPPADTIFTIDANDCSIEESGEVQVTSNKPGHPSSPVSQGFSRVCRQASESGTSTDTSEPAETLSSGACSFSSMKTPLKRKGPQTQHRKVKAKVDEDPVNNVLKSINGYVEKKKDCNKVDGAIAQILEAVIERYPLDAKIMFMQRCLKIAGEMNLYLGVGDNLNETQSGIGDNLNETQSSLSVL